MNLFEHLNKKAVIGMGAAILILFCLFFFWLLGTPGDDAIITELPASPLNASLGRDLLAALAKLKSTKLDTSIFEDPVFGTLKDFGVEIAAQPVGRRNPFGSFSGNASSRITGAGSVRPPLPTGTVKPATQTVSPVVSEPEPDTDGFDEE